MVTIHGEEKELLGLDDRHQIVHKVPNRQEHLLLSETCHAAPVTMRARVDDSIHVEVKIV